MGGAQRAGDQEAESDARRRVGDAKLALGERGEPWWATPTDAGQRARVAAAMFALLRSRRPESSICPSDVARTVGGDQWRRLLPVVRQVAGELAADRVVEVSQRGQPVVATDAKGPVRIRRGDRFT